MTTWLDKETVLLQISYRYMLFDKDGKFISNIGFNDIQDDEVDHTFKRMRTTKIISR